MLIFFEIGGLTFTPEKRASIVSILGARHLFLEKKIYRMNGHFVVMGCIVQKKVAESDV